MGGGGGGGGGGEGRVHLGGRGGSEIFFVIYRGRK